MQPENELGEIRNPWSFLAIYPPVNVFTHGTKSTRNTTKNIKICKILHFPFTEAQPTFRADERQMQLVPAPTKKRKITSHLLHGAPGTGLPLPGVWCVGCPSWVRSIGPVRRCVGEYGRTGVEKLVLSKNRNKKDYGRARGISRFW